MNEKEEINILLKFDLDKSFEYSINALNKILEKENSFLKTFLDPNNIDPEAKYGQDWADTNFKCCKHRIEDLKNSIAILKQIVNKQKEEKGKLKTKSNE